MERFGSMLRRFLPLVAALVVGAFLMSMLGTSMPWSATRGPAAPPQNQLPPPPALSAPAAAPANVAPPTQAGAGAPAQAPAAVAPAPAPEPPHAGPVGAPNGPMARPEPGPGPEAGRPEPAPPVAGLGSWLSAILRPFQLLFTFFQLLGALALIGIGALVLLGRRGRTHRTEQLPPPASHTSE